MEVKLRLRRPQSHLQVIPPDILLLNLQDNSSSAMSKFQANSPRLPRQEHLTCHPYPLQLLTPAIQHLRLHQTHPYLHTVLRCPYLAKAIHRKQLLKLQVQYPPKPAKHRLLHKDPIKVVPHLHTMEAPLLCRRPALSLRQLPLVMQPVRPATVV